MGFDCRISDMHLARLDSGRLKTDAVVGSLGDTVDVKQEEEH